MMFFVALLLGLLAYVLVKLVLEHVTSLASQAELIALIVGILVCLMYVGVIH